MKTRFLRIFVSALVSLFFLSIKAQEKRFVYFQTENGNPFYLKWKDSVISSTERGYLILSGMDTGKHTINIGFPQNVAPSTFYMLNLENNDLGYLIKQNTERGIVLEDLQTKVVLTSEKPAIIDPGYEPGDAFSTLLVEVTGDSSVLNKKSNPINAERTETAKSDSVQTKTAANPVISKEKESNRQITRLYTRLDSSGRLLTYVVPGKEKNDTVVLFISYPKAVKETKAVIETKVKEKNKVVPSTENKKTENKTDTSSTKQSDIKVQVEGSRNKTAKGKDSLKVDQVKNIKEADTANRCKNAATERDFINLRRKMVDQYEEKLMQEVALQSFRKKCYTSLQIKNLCVLFLKEKSRLEFLKIAYPFAVDKENFYLLQSLFADPVLIAQFRSMLNLAKE